MRLCKTTNELKMELLSSGGIYRIPLIIMIGHSALILGNT